MRDAKAVREAAIVIVQYLPYDLSDAKKICEEALRLCQWRDCDGDLRPKLVDD